MTKKDYILIARSLWRAGYRIDANKVRQAGQVNMRRLIAIDLASSLQNENPRFDYKRFLEACDVTDSA